MIKFIKQFFCKHTNTLKIGRIMERIVKDNVPDGTTRFNNFEKDFKSVDVMMCRKCRQVTFRDNNEKII